MKQHFLKITANNQPAILEQLLRVARFRGFKVDRISMSLSNQEQLMDIAVNVNSARPIHLLENQLRKLVDVTDVLIEKTVAVQATVNKIF